MFRRALELEKEIQKVQRSTKTLFKFFASSHNWLRMKSRPYYAWSMQPFSHAIHWAILALMILASPLAFLNSNGKTTPIEAAGYTFTENFSTETYKHESTTADWNTTATSVSSPYSSQPSIGAEGGFFSGSMTNTGTVYVPSLDVVYIFGGQRSGEPNTLIYKYDASSSSISTISATLDRNPLGKTSAVYIEESNLIYIVSGTTSSYSTHVWKFNLADESISRLSTELPDLHDSGVAYNPTDHKIYVVGGLTINGNEERCDIEDGCMSVNIYTLDVSNDNNQFLNSDTEARNANSVVVFGTGEEQSDYMYIIGGYTTHTQVKWTDCVEYECCALDYAFTSFNTTNRIVKYKISTKQTAATYAGKMTDLEGAANQGFTQIGNTIYFYGGEYGSTTGGFTSSNKISVLDLTTLPDTGMVTTGMPTLPTGAKGLSAIYDTVSDKNYLFGIDDKLYSHEDSTLTDVTGPGSLFDGLTPSAFGQTSTDGYILGGDESNSILKYHLADRSVSQVGNFAGSPNGRGVTAENGKIYFFGGDSPRAVYEFDPSGPTLAKLLDESVDLLSFDCPRGSCSAVYDQVNNKIIIAGGSGPTYIQEYTPGTTSVTEPTVLEDYSSGMMNSGFWSGDKAYFVTNSEGDPNCYVYNPDKSVASFSCPIMYGSDGQIYLYGTQALTFQNNGSAYYIGHFSPYHQSSVSRIDFSADGFTSRKISPTVSSNIDRTANVLANFFDASSGKTYIVLTNGAYVEMNLNILENTDEVISKKICPESLLYHNNLISQATLTATENNPPGTSVDFFMSANGGENWEPVQSGQSHTFDATGTDLRWRALLNSTITDSPSITSVQINYLGTPYALRFDAAEGMLKNGLSSPINISLYDIIGMRTIAKQDIAISIASNTPLIKFAGSESGPWLGSLNLVLPAGQEDVQFYAITYEHSGLYNIIAQSSGFIDITLPVRVYPSNYSATFSFDPVSPTVVVGNTIDLTAIVVNSLGSEYVRNRMITFLSSTSQDIITQPDSLLANDGVARGKIYSTVAGTKTITLRLSPNEWLSESSQKVTFLPAAVSAVTLSSSSGETVKAGSPLTLSTSFYDGYGNLATNSTDKLTITSSDSSFSSLPYQFTSADEGDHDFNIVLKTAGKQTITVKDNATGANGTLNITVLADSPLASSSSISSSKTKLVLGHDIATISVKIADGYGNAIPDTTVHIKNALSYGSLDKFDSKTDSSGIATFVYTPSKEGKEDFHAYTDTFEIPNTLSIEIVADNLLNQLGSVIDDLQNNAIAKAIASAANAIVAATAALGLIPLIAGIISGAPAAAHAVTYAFSLGLEAIGAKKRRRSWGRVYDSTTGRGIDMATVRLFDQGTMKLVSTVVTDLKGHFSFQPEAGKYTVSVIKDSYVFPTNIFAKYGIATIDKSASRINSHYVGQTVTVTGDNNLVNLEIPIDPHNKKPTFMVKAKVFLSDFFEMVTSGLSYIFMPSIVIGALLSVFAAVILPTVRNQTICLTYVLVALLYIISHLIKVGKFSVVYDQRDKKPIPEAVVSIFDKQYNTLKETRITDKFGRFSISVPKGEYRIKVEREGFIFPSEKVKKKKRFLNDGRYTNLYFGEEIDAKKEKFINVSVPMDEKYGKLTIK